EDVARRQSSERVANRRGTTARIGKHRALGDVDRALFLKALERIGDRRENRLGFTARVMRGGRAQSGANARENFFAGGVFRRHGFFPTTRETISAAREGRRDFSPRVAAGRAACRRDAAPALRASPFAPGPRRCENARSWSSSIATA